MSYHENRRDYNYDENTAELQWLENSATDLFSITCCAIGGLFWAVGTILWSVMLLVATIVDAVASTRKS